MTNEELNKPVTVKYLAEYTKQVLLPEIETMFDEKLLKLENTILTSDDKLSKKT